MTKRILAIFLSLGLILSMVGCGSNEPSLDETFPTLATVVGDQTQPTQTTPTQSAPTEPSATEPSVTEPSQSIPVTEPSQTVPTTEPITEPSTEPTIPTTEPTTQPTEPTTEPTAEPTTQPTEPSVPANHWTPLCQEYINFRATPGGKLIGTIAVGETVILNKWYNKYALVTYNGVQGYVASNYIKPLDNAYFAQRLQVVTLSNWYSYDQMRTDMAALQALHPDTVRVSSIGLSEMGREIPVLQVGSPNASRHVLMQGAIHAREHFTACLLMALADYYLTSGIDADVCYHIIPMSNPDGVILAQSGTLNEAQKEIYQRDLTAGYTYLGQTAYAQYWKSNALGVDLNRNFSSGWENSLERPLPSSEKYRGTEPFSAAESRALRDYTMSYNFNVTISVHSHGSEIYYQYGKRQPVNQLSYSLALAAQSATGYTPISTDGTSGAGYKDWAMEVMGIPSLTIEVCNDFTPVEQRDMYNTFARCEGLIPAINIWMVQNS